MRSLRYIINKKLFFIILFIFIFTVLMEYFKLQKTIRYYSEQVSDSTQILAANLEGTLLFDSKLDFYSLTEHFDFDNDYWGVEVYKNGDDLFAKRGRQVEIDINSFEHVHLTFDYIFVKKPIISAGAEIGVIVIQRSTKRLISSLEDDLILFFVTIFFLVILFYFAARQINEDITTPINALSETIKNILESDDLSIRVEEKHKVAETFELSQSFNALVRNLGSSRDDLNSLNQTLENQVQEKTKKLSKALDDMKKYQTQLVSQEKLSSLGALTAGIAHEIKNPLNLIINSSSIISHFSTEAQKFSAKVIDKTVTEEEINYFIEDLDDVKMASSIINENGFRADSIIKSMLSQSRSQKSELTDINIVQVLEQAVNLSYHAMKAKPDMIEVEISKFLPKEVYVNCFPDDLERAFINILDNSFYAMREKQKIDPKYKAVLDISLTINNSRVEIVIEDNGVGISKEKIDKIFEPFFTTKPTGEGTGLGMGMVNDVVRAHQGEIKINSEEGQFTKTTIYISSDIGEI